MTSNGEAEPTEPNLAATKAARKRADRKRKQRVEFAGAIIIAIAAVLTALATYQSGDADGTVEERNTQGIALSLEANDTYNLADAARAEERDWMFSWIAAATNEEPAADVLLAAMPTEVLDLAIEWLEANGEFFENPDILLVDDPFTAVYSSYSLLPSEGLLFIADDIFRQAKCAFFEAQEAAVQGDGLGLSTVFLAIALVVGGIAALLNGKAAQFIVLTIATLSLVAGAAEYTLASDLDEVRAIAAAEYFLNEDGSEMAMEEDSNVPVDIPAALDRVAQVCPEIAR